MFFILHAVLFIIYRFYSKFVENKDVCIIAKCWKITFHLQVDQTQ